MRTLAGVVLSLVVSAGIATADGPHHTSAPVSTFATDLNNPRGLKFGPDGTLYVSNVGFAPGFPPPTGLGEIVKIELGD